MSMVSAMSYGGGAYGSYGNWQNVRGVGEDFLDPLAVGQESPNGADAAEDEEKVPGEKSSPAECETCKNRKYQDGSDEMVSFKAAGHIAPGNAASVVLGHEHEHVSNAYRKAELNNGEVQRCSVRLKMDVCPECGRSYVSGGVTSTQIKYYHESNPYQKELKSSDAINKYQGANVDIAA